MASITINSSKYYFDQTNRLINIEYSINNNNDKPIWIVSDNELVVQSDTSKIVTLSYAREKLKDGVIVFGYFFPNIEKLEAHKSIKKIIALKIPYSLNTTWNEKSVFIPESGAQFFRIKIGFGHRKNFVDNDGDFNSPEEIILKWQDYAYSGVFLLNIIE